MSLVLASYISLQSEEHTPREECELSVFQESKMNYVGLTLA